MHRTPSEIQLCEDKDLADYRDYRMFARIVDGISRCRQSSNQGHDLIYEYDAYLASFRQTQSRPSKESESHDARHELVLQKLIFPSNPFSSAAQPHAVYDSNLNGNDNMILDENGNFVIELWLSCICTYTVAWQLEET